MASIINATTTNGVAVQGDNSGSLQLQTNSGTTAVTIDTSQNVGIGETSPAGSAGYTQLVVRGSSGAELSLKGGTTQYGYVYVDNGGFRIINPQSGASSGTLQFHTSNTERMRITSGGELCVNGTATSPATADAEGVSIGNNGSTQKAGVIQCSVAGGAALYVNRKTDDGNLVQFYQAAIQEGTISVSGTTVSYNGGHLSRWSQLPSNQKDDTLLKGTVMSNLDEMCVWEKEGVIADNEQLNKMKVSDVEGDTNVAGVFVNWTKDDDFNSDDMNIAMTGDMIIRIAQGVVVQKGDLLMSAGDGTAKPQGDDIVRSKTIAKVTSNHVTCTYADGSYCVPCVLMAC